MNSLEKLIFILIFMNISLIMKRAAEGMGGRGEGVDDELVAALWLIVGPWR